MLSRYHCHTLNKPSTSLMCRIMTTLCHKWTAWGGKLLHQARQRPAMWQEAAAVSPKSAAMSHLDCQPCWYSWVTQERRAHTGI